MTKILIIFAAEKYYSHVLFNVLAFPLNKKETFISIPFYL